MRKRLAVAAAAAVFLLAPAATAHASSLPVIYNGVLGYAHESPSASPPGANDWSCKPTSAHPRPVILVHGTFADMSDSWQALSPLLYDSGYCVLLQQQCPLDQGEHLSMPLRPHHRRRRAQCPRPGAPGADRLHSGAAGQRRLDAMAVEAVASV
ncbi:MAG TPA: hypothetical protein VKE27_07865 [Candidatus Dormibacteraeota bacterium]|nr:hypothetical protein [Candidatus Dormibacteraeota bacterium]